jgi:hypothetical protein
MLTLKNLDARPASPSGYFIREAAAQALVQRPEHCKLGRLPQPGYSCDVLVEGVVYELMHTSSHTNPWAKGGATWTETPRQVWWLMPTSRKELK